MAASALFAAMAGVNPQWRRCMSCSGNTVVAMDGHATTLTAQLHPLNVGLTSMR